MVAASPERQLEIVCSLLRELPFFGELPLAALSGVARGTSFRSVERGEVVFDYGDRVQDVHCVLDGMVKLLVRSGRISELVGAGQTFGEGLVFLDQPSPGRAVAIDAGQLLVVPGRLLVGTIETSPGFAVRMLRRVSQRIGRLLAELESDTAHSAAQRIVRWLAAQAGAETGETVVRLDVSKATLAALLNTTPETFSRVLQHLRRQGIVRVDRQNIVVLDPFRLRSLHPCVFCQQRRTPVADDDAADAGLGWEQLAAARFECDVPH